MMMPRQERDSPGRVLDGIGSAHHRLVHVRRVSQLANAIVGLVPADSYVVDVGCGDGALAALIKQRGTHLRIDGYDVMPRLDAAMPVKRFDGRRLPLGDTAADVVLLIDVLHHTTDPVLLLREAARVARTAVIIKDHRVSRPDARAMLRVMDWIGNRPQQVPLTYNYWPESHWREAWASLGLRVDHYETRLNLYPWPASWMFERGLHFLARLTKDPAR
jgi:SAM-dependent methyltransferase